MKLTKTDLRNLEKLKGKATALQNDLDKLVKSAQEITKENEDGGWTFDYILNGIPETVEELAEKLK
jgi:hypothetical protein